MTLDAHQTLLENQVTALILAGARVGVDSVARAAGVSSKVFALVGGVPMIERVLNTLGASSLVGLRVLCGPSWELIEQQPVLRASVEKGAIKWMSPQSGPSLSVQQFLKESPGVLPLLVTTADHALLEVEFVERFLRQAYDSRVDVAVALVPYSVVAQAYPSSKRTVIRFRDGGFCGCNLFLLRTPQAGRLVEFWAQVENDRKRPIRLLRRLGWPMVVRYLAGRLSLIDALDELGRRLNLSIKEVILPYPDAAVDVDTPEDLVLAEQVLARRAYRCE